MFQYDKDTEYKLVLFLLHHTKDSYETWDIYTLIFMIATILKNVRKHSVAIGGKMTWGKTNFYFQN